MLQVQQEAKRAVASMLERAGMSDRIKSVMGMLRRYESLFRLPSRIMQETECGEFEAVKLCPSLLQFMLQPVCMAGMSITSCKLSKELLLKCLSSLSRRRPKHSFVLL